MCDVEKCMQCRSYDALLQNKRECFDAMRAYHQSEIAHAGFAIHMLLAVTAAAGAAILAIIFPARTTHSQGEVYVAWGVTLAVIYFAYRIAFAAEQKIESDHARYAAYGAEYVRTSDALGFFRPQGFYGAQLSIKTEEARQLGQGLGYRKTLKSIWSYADGLTYSMLIFVTLTTFSR